MAAGHFSFVGFLRVIGLEPEQSVHEPAHCFPALLSIQFALTIRTRRDGLISTSQEKDITSLVNREQKVFDEFQHDQAFNLKLRSQTPAVVFPAKEIAFATGPVV